jgi:hypothetical protein
MFTPAEHPYVGTHRAYLPQGMTPYGPAIALSDDVILPTGDGVEVLSAWSRDYLPEGPTLLYVRSDRTGRTTHVVAADVRLEVTR